MKQPTSIIVQLVHIHGPLKGEIQEFSGNEIIIGRHASCDLQFPRDLVAISRKHANILRDGNRFKIVDQSTNGTFVNGERITEAYLKNGDVIFFTQGGPKVSFLTRIGEPVEPPPELKPCQSTYSTHKTPSQPVSQPISQPVPLFVPKPAPAPQPVIQVETVKVPLIIQYGPVLQSFNELPITIGTHPDCNLILEHPSLAERHIQIFFSQGSYRVKDLTGRNPILINHQPVISPSPIMPGDKLFLTANGPGFHFMEGGRMAEIDIPPQEAAKDPENAEPLKKQEPSVKKTGSLFNKLFR